jgi:heptosyltransferase I
MTRLLIIAPTPLAELVHGLQVATSLRAQWPEERGELEIHWVARDLFAPLAQACAAVDRCFVFKRQGGTLDFLRLTREVRETRYDYLFDFQGLLRTGLLTWRAHARKKVGRANAREGASAFYHVKVQPPVGRRHHKLEALLQFCAVLDLEPELAGVLRFRGLERLKLDFVQGKPGLRPVVMFPDSKRDEKNWPGYKQLTKLILQGDRSRRVVWAG